MKDTVVPDPSTAASREANSNPLKSGFPPETAARAIQPGPLAICFALRYKPGLGLE